MINSKSVRMGNNFHNFIVRLIGNRTPDIDFKNISQEKACNLIVNYFKSNNDRYLELVKMEIKNV